MAFTYKLELEDGTPAEPSELSSAVPTWRPGDLIPLWAKRSSTRRRHPPRNGTRR
jgi:hypothetical protein